MSTSVYNDDYKKLIERLKQARLDAGLSQQVVADELNKPQSYVSKVESGDRRLDIIEVPNLKNKLQQTIPSSSRALARLVLWLCMKPYKQIDKAERLEIGILLERGYSDAEIARVLGRDRSTIYRERKRNSVKAVYTPRKAQHKAYVRRTYAKYQAMCIVKDMKL